MSPLDKYSICERIQIENLIKSYLKYGSLDKVFQKDGDNLAFSYPNAHKILDEWGVVKSVGRQKSSIAETLYFFESLVLKRIPITKLIKSMPREFHSSTTSLYRVYKNIMNGITRNEATALIVIKNKSILIGDDLFESERKCQVTLPVTYASSKEKTEISILRTLQQEVFSKEVLHKRNFSDFISPDTKPYLVIDIADIRCKVFVLNLDTYQGKLPKFTSFKLANLRLITKNTFYKSNNINWRPGIREIINYYFSNPKTHITLRYIKADLNLSLPG